MTRRSEYPRHWRDGVKWELTLDAGRGRARWRATAIGLLWDSHLGAPRNICIPTLAQGISFMGSAGSMTIRRGGSFTAVSAAFAYLTPPRIHPSICYDSFVLRPSSFVLRPSSFVLRPSSFVLLPSSPSPSPSPSICYDSFVLRPSTSIPIPISVPISVAVSTPISVPPDRLKTAIPSIAEGGLDSAGVVVAYSFLLSFPLRGVRDEARQTSVDVRWTGMYMDCRASTYARPIASSAHSTDEPRGSGFRFFDLFFRMFLGAEGGRTYRDAHAGCTAPAYVDARVPWAGH
ncbi:hypothetical protein C8R47DRAFT_1229051 [Mycena vitilis]|nr:hypothetical protein C8R47DRAFT_1229051 [Mycena vitilis]